MKKPNIIKTKRFSVRIEPSGLSEIYIKVAGTGRPATTKLVTKDGTKPMVLFDLDKNKNLVGIEII